MSENFKPFWKVLDSEYETLSQSDTDSVYMTGLEDLIEIEPNKQKKELILNEKIFSCFEELCHTSSFLHDIIYEDSRTGIDVVDLFVAVKIVKGKLDILSKSNSELYYKISDLNKEAKIFRMEYKNFLKTMRAFLAEIKEDHSELSEGDYLRTVEEGLNQNEIENFQEEQKSKCEWEESESEAQRVWSGETNHNCETSKNFSIRFGDRCQKCDKKESEECKSKSKWTCSMCGRDLKGEKTENDCLGCFTSSFKHISLNHLPILSEALLGSFLAFFMWLLRGQEGTLTSTKSSKSSSPASQTMEEEKESDGSFGNPKLNESTIQMICDICEILNEATFQELNLEEVSHFSLKKTEETDGDLELANWVTCESRLRDRCKSFDVKVTPSSERKVVKRSFLKEISTFSNGTKSPPNCLNCGKRSAETNKSSKTVVEAKDEFSSEDDSDFEEALTGPLTPLTPSPQHEMKTPSVSCMGDLTKAVMGKKSVSTFTHTNEDISSWVGRLSDEIRSKINKIKSKANVKVTERPFGKSEKDFKVASTFPGSVQFTITAKTPVGVFDVTVVQYKKHRLSDCIWSEDSFHNSDSEPVWADSVSAEDELEEFLEIYVGNSKTNKKNEKVVHPLQEKGVLKKVLLKTDKGHFFEIQKCHPVYSVEEIVQKFQKPKLDEQLELEKFQSAISEEEKEIVSCFRGEKQKKQVVIGRSSNDLVIYIEVEVEEGWSPNSSEFLMENQTTSLGTQTSENNSKHSALINERIIRLNETEMDGESLFHVWKGCETKYSEEIEEKERITFDEPLMVLEKSEAEMRQEHLQDEEKVLLVREGDEKEMTFNQELSETYIENEIQETYLDEDEEKFQIMGTANLLIMKESRQHTNIWLLQNEIIHRINILILQPVPEVAPEIIETINTNAVELAKALNLIHEIESDVNDVKLDDAISILPQLESELRKHLQSKIKNIEEKESELESSVDNFFSAVDFWPDDEFKEDNNSDSSSERLNILLKLLSDLEEAVKYNEYSSEKLEICQFSSSKIYNLLHALTVSIRELEEHPNVTSLSQTLDIASQLDIAVREYDNIIKKQPLDYATPRRRLGRKCKSLEEMPVKHHLKNVRKKVFEMIEEEAFNLEGRIERDFDRLDRIERENHEAMTFLEAFLEKTERRMIELSNLKFELKNLSSSLSDSWKTFREAIARRKEKEKEMETEKQILQRKKSKERSALDSLSRDLSPAVKEEPVRETVSGLLIALDSLKSRAREKKEVCKEILLSTGFEMAQDSENSSRRSSRSSFTTKHAEKLIASVKECKKIGSTSLYLSWTEPEGPLKDSIMGYQIYVNGKLNQKVRNPQRLQAVLYSIDFTKEIQIQLYALTENHPKTLLATLGYYDE